MVVDLLGVVDRRKCLCGPMLLQRMEIGPALFATRLRQEVNDMTAASSRSEVLPGRARVVPRVRLLDAVSKRHARRRHGCSCTTTASQQALAPLGIEPAFGMDANHACSPGTSTAEARSCSRRSYPPFGAQRRSPSRTARLPTQPQAWYKKPVTKPTTSGAEVPDRGHSIDLFTAWAPR